MTQGGRSIRGRSGNMHPLFIELYLRSDSDDSDEKRQAERRARQRKSIPQKRVTRQAWRNLSHLAQR